MVVVTTIAWPARATAGDATAANSSIASTTTALATESLLPMGYLLEVPRVLPDHTSSNSEAGAGLQILWDERMACSRGVKLAACSVRGPRATTPSVSRRQHPTPSSPGQEHADCRISDARRLGPHP